MGGGGGGGGGGGVSEYETHRPESRDQDPRPKFPFWIERLICFYVFFFCFFFKFVHLGLYYEVLNNIIQEKGNLDRMWELDPFARPFAHPWIRACL